MLSAQPDQTSQRESSSSRTLPLPLTPLIGFASAPPFAHLESFALLLPGGNKVALGLFSLTFPQSPMIYADSEGVQRKVPVALLGEGMSTLLSLILAIATANNGIILIDEIDTGLQYTVLAAICERLSLPGYCHNTEVRMFESCL